jgi:hypothetical protein
MQYTAASTVRSGLPAFVQASLAPSEELLSCETVKDGRFCFKAPNGSYAAWVLFRIATSKTQASARCMFP